MLTDSTLYLVFVALGGHLSPFVSVFDSLCIPGGSWEPLFPPPAFDSLILEGLSAAGRLLRPRCSPPLLISPSTASRLSWLLGATFRIVTCSSSRDAVDTFLFSPPFTHKAAFTGWDFSWVGFSQSPSLAFPVTHSYTFPLPLSRYSPCAP